MPVKINVRLAEYHAANDSRFDAAVRRLAPIINQLREKTDGRSKRKLADRLNDMGPHGPNGKPMKNKSIIAIATVPPVHDPMRSSTHPKNAMVSSGSNGGTTPPENGATACTKASKKSSTLVMPEGCEDTTTENLGTVFSIIGVNLPGCR